jgi:DNA-directed RNA polymerase specialized sigma24 family protein
MGGDMGSLYDAHADRLYVYCWSLVGDQRAAAAVGDAFTAAVHHPPRGDRVLWLYSLARTACAEHGAFTGGPADGRRPPLFDGSDPLLRAAGSLRSDHREVLLLWAGEWLEPHDIALVLGIAPDTVAQLLNAARARLERAVLDILMRGATEPGLDLFPLITAFEKGRLPQLLARRAPSRAPSGLRERVLATCEAETTRPLPSVVAPSPLVVIGAEKGRSANDVRRRGLSGGVSKGLGAAAGVAASAAAVIGLLAAWPSGKGGGSSASLVPTASSGQADAAVRTADGPRHPLPGLTGTESAPNGSRAASDDPATRIPGVPPWRDGAEPGTPSSSAAPKTSSPGKPSGHRDPASTPPGTPGKPTTPPPGGGSPTTPPDDGTTGPTTPPGGGTTDPTTPPEDPPPTGDPGTPGPSPETNPSPSPETGPSQGQN